MNIFVHTAEIQKKTIAQTSAGTVNPTYSTRIASLSCLVQGKTLQTENEFNKETLVNIYRLYTLNDSTSSTITTSDRVIWQTRQFEITGIKDGGGRSHHYEIDMLEVE